MRCTAFERLRCVGAGDLRDVALKTRAVVARGQQEPVLVFNDDTGELIELDLRGSDDDVLRRLSHQDERPAPDAPIEPPRLRGPGRPRLGVVAREVTLLPRHWDWLATQPGGASVALRRLVDEARKTHADRDRVRHAREVAYRVLSALAGNLAGFEEAMRALFAGDAQRFDEQTSQWPPDVRAYALRLAAPAFEEKAHAVSA
jgi:hypothetical protein